MEFSDISASTKIYPGQFLFYQPQNTIVKCCAFLGNKIRVVHNGKIFEDVVASFKMINKKE